MHLAGGKGRERGALAGRKKPKRKTAGSDFGSDFTHARSEWRAATRRKREARERESSGWRRRVAPLHFPSVSFLSRPARPATDRAVPFQRIPPNGPWERMGAQANNGARWTRCHSNGPGLHSLSVRRIYLPLLSTRRDSPSASSDESICFDSPLNAADPPCSQEERIVFFSITHHVLYTN